MNYLDLVKFSVSDIWRRKFSSFLTFLAISIGISAVFLIIVVSDGFESSVQGQLEEMGTDMILVTSGGLASADTEVTEDDVIAFERERYIERAFGLYYSAALQVSIGNQEEIAGISGTDITGEFFGYANWELESGRFARDRETNVAILGSGVEENILNRDISLGQTIRIEDVNFQVIGFLEEFGAPEDDNEIYVPLNDLQDLKGDEDKVTLLYGFLQRGYEMEEARDEAEKFFEDRLGEDEVQVQTPEQLLEQFDTILGLIRYTFGGIALISLLVGALGIINTMFVIVTEKVREIGIMKSVGARNKDIWFLFTMQSGAFGFFGALLGVILGSIFVLLAEYFIQQAGYGFLEIPITFGVVISMLLFGFVVGIISGLLPSYRASKINLIDAIRK